MYGEEEEEVDYGPLSEDDVISLGDTTQFQEHGQNLAETPSQSAGPLAATSNGQASRAEARQPSSKSVVETPLQIPGSPPQLKVPSGLPQKPLASLSMSPSTSMSKRDLPEVREVRRERDAPQQESSRGKPELPPASRSARDLPLGWFEKVSSSGRTYYYCPATDKSSWERPTASAPKVQPANVPGSRNQVEDRERSSRQDRDSRLPARDEARTETRRVSDRYDAVRPARTRTISPPPRRPAHRSRSPPPSRLPPIESRVAAERRPVDYSDRVRSRPHSRERSPPPRSTRLPSPDRRSSLKHELDRELDRYQSSAAPAAPRRSRSLLSLSNTRRLINLSSSVTFASAQITTSTFGSLTIST